MLKMAVAVWVEPMAVQFRAMLKKTTNQTALTGVWVCLFTLERKLLFTYACVYVLFFSVVFLFLFVLLCGVWRKNLRGKRQRIITGKCIRHSSIR